MLDWGKVRFFWAEVVQNFTRNYTMALTAIGTIAISVVILGVFLFLRMSFDRVMQNIVGQVSIAVYLRDDASGAAVGALTKSLQGDPRVDDVKYVSKRRALMNLRQSLRGQFNFNTLNTNPLPNTLVVHTKIPDDVPALAAEIQASPVVANVNYGSNVTERLLRAEKVASAVGLGVIALLIVATALIMYNTIRLTVFARQREIRIMQLVGATGWAVRWPFVFEGILSGLLGSALGLLALSAGYRSFAPKLVVNMPFIPFDPAQVPLPHIALELLVVGILVGMLSSVWSVGRYLKAA
jgi:cell division transport system permease protein